jgi:anti-sigma regulatory factor (Ser/Thr protein kinase)
MPPHHRVILTEGIHAPARARAWLAAQAPHLPTNTADDALLMVSELVTNAVRHGRPDIVLSLSIASDRLRIEVYDASDDMPLVAADHPSFDRATGRGLLIVAATAEDWGVARTPGRPGKTVWAELDCRG